MSTAAARRARRSPFVETETSTSEEHELETTDRFEMSREASETIKEDVALKAGLTISGSYGPTVEFAASAEGSFSRSKEEATKSATTFSQDVTERTSRKISERVLQRTTVRTLTEVLEKNVHSLDNTTGTGHISGVYQWVNKVYQAQMFNYGLRMMFDFMIPEPAAFLVAAMNQAQSSALTLTKPPDFTLAPAQITESNYSYWVKVCGATDVAPPPELFRTKSADFKGGGGDSKTNYNHSAQIAIDDGYRAVFGSVGRVWNVWESDASVDVVLGRRTQRMSRQPMVVDDDAGRRTRLDPVRARLVPRVPGRDRDRGEVPTDRPCPREVAPRDLRKVARGP